MFTKTLQIQPSDFDPLICLSLVFLGGQIRLISKLNMEGGKAMSTPSHNDRMELEIFNSFSKTVMRNIGKNIASASKTIETNETVSTDTVQYIGNTR